MPKSLADGHTRVALLSVKPANPNAPTLQELNDGIDASCRINSADYNVTPAASETVEEKELCIEGNAVAFGPSNATVEFTPFRYFTEMGLPEPTAAGEIGDAIFQATKTKGTRLWIYHRETSKKATDPWEGGDPVDGFEFITDNPQQVDRTGYIKRKIVGAYQNMWLNGTVDGGVTATGATAGTPGSFTPTGATPPADLATLQAGSITADPTTAWTTGQYVLLGDSSKAYWDGTNWVNGTAP